MPGSICDVLPSAAALLGVGEADPLGIATQLERPRTVVLVLVDGLGLHLLPAVARHAPLLAAAAGGEAQVFEALHCEFPSTTPTSLVSLGTGARPGAHGVLGFTVREPASGRVLTHVSWGERPDPDVWQPVPTWFERLATAGLSARAVLPAAFVGSGLTRAAYRGAVTRGVPDGDDYPQALVDEVLAGYGGTGRGGGHSLVYGYTAALDTAAHVYGIDSLQWQRAATEVDTLLSRVRDALPSDAVLLVTADHGGLNVPPDARIDVDTDSRLVAGVRAVVGEPRVRYLHIEPDARSDVLAAWRDVLGDAADVLTREEAVGRDLFGPVPESHLGRIGDVVVICTGDAAIFASEHEPAAVRELVGFHGGLQPVERDVPLFGWAAG